VGARKGAVPAAWESEMRTCATFEVHIWSCKGNDKQKSNITNLGFGARRTAIRAIAVCVCVCVRERVCTRVWFYLRARVCVCSRGVLRSIPAA
jgi:hypothetical protein